MGPGHFGGVWSPVGLCSLEGDIVGVSTAWLGPGWGAA